MYYYQIDTCSAICLIKAAIPMKAIEFHECELEHKEIPEDQRFKVENLRIDHIQRNELFVPDKIINLTLKGTTWNANLFKFGAQLQSLQSLKINVKPGDSQNRSILTALDLLPKGKVLDIFEIKYDRPLNVRESPKTSDCVKNW